MQEEHLGGENGFPDCFEFVMRLLVVFFCTQSVMKFPWECRPIGKIWSDGLITWANMDGAIIPLYSLLDASLTMALPRYVVVGHDTRWRFV